MPSLLGSNSYWHYLALWFQATRTGDHERKQHLDTVLRAIAAYHAHTLTSEGNGT